MWKFVHFLVFYSFVYTFLFSLNLFHHEQKFNTLRLLCIFSLQDFIFNKMRDNLNGVFKEMYGSYVIECILTNGSAAHKNHIANVVLEVPLLLDLIDHCYANYIVQHIIGLYSICFVKKTLPFLVILL